ncbi:hypothetical protein HK099_000866 [Clydaea vesicula]|uniref:Uncharacterized protein n=1 Tax=Clydaea vesicula TaxID=447962 RepID=A0AAD5XXA1_9FUNG|nr:hypothetical protein HK099_000866 [Clydaea vesicula]KAJ3381836.1 hypothetical protein HDU92_005105 [Lobulomyces angularis]
MQKNIADQNKEEFRSHVTDFTYEAITTYELKLLSIINQIIEKPFWYQKINNQEIRSKWYKELQDSEQFPVKMIDFALEELLYKANNEFFVKKLPDGACITCGPVEETFISDNLINNELLEDLKKCVSVLENVPDSEKDWHPYSNNLVLDLVHPSLYCIKSGKTLSKDGNTIMLSADGNDVFQWIPSDVFIDADYSAKLLSPINSLHPEIHKNTTEVIMKIFSKFIPMFENMLNVILNGPPGSRIKLPYTLWDEFDESEPEGVEAQEEYYRRMDEYHDNRPLLDPELNDFKPYIIKKPYSLLNKHVQVIVKLANIQLTPEKPKYDGGVWHCEGTQHENIVSTGIYYYDNKNITQSKLSFRVGVFEPWYEQGDNRGMGLGYGLHDEELLIQPVGSIISKEHRSIVFPNTMQHLVEPFELEDKTIPGHRKILAFFLIDPTKKIHSTGDIQPQQLNWTLDMLQEILKNKLPPEIILEIVKRVDGLISLETAKEWRLELMEARKASNEMFYDHDGPVFLRHFSLCEH